MNFRKYLVLAGVALFSAIGDSLLSRGMKEVGSISISHISRLVLVITSPLSGREMSKARAE